MEQTNKKASGYYLTLISIILALISVLCYLFNSSTAYFSNLGMNAPFLICIAGGILAEIFYLTVGGKAEKDKLCSGFMPTDILVLASSVLLMIATVTFIKIRVYGFASILTFEMSAQNMNDLISAAAGIVFCLAAVILSMVAASHALYQTEKSVK